MVTIMPMLNIKSKALGNMGSLVGVQILNYLLPIITIPIIVRIIGPSKLGTINYVSSIVNYFVLLIGFNFELSATRLIAMRPNDQVNLNDTFSRVFFSKLVLFVGSTIVFIAFLLFSKDLLENSLVAIYSYLLCLATVFDSNFLFIAKQDLKQTAFFNLMTKILMNLSLLYFIRKQSDFVYQPLIISLSQIIVMCSAFFWAISRYHISIKFPRFKPVWQMLWEGRSLFFHSFAHTLYTTINIVMLGLMGSITMVGYYTAGWKLIILIQALLISPLGMVLFPIISQAFGKSSKAGIEMIQKALPLILLVTVMIGFGILIFAGMVIKIFYGDAFHESIHLFRLLSFMPLLLALNMLLGIQTMVNLRMDKSFMKITIMAALVNVGMNFLFIHYWNASGAAVSWFLTEMFCTVSMLIVLFKHRVLLYNPEYFNLRLATAVFTTVTAKIKDKLLKRPTLGSSAVPPETER